ncbi:uncharacterized protein LOC129309740 isoform X2 [Prosopis cineraria]|uniref:uncharacterized protein LOC129309740 isoform X2 n=1 Tax=Prosopis cineraria TaxID=364024 RepID=UPI00240F95EC|nr:uncharacterized protein LOC129309740 isoform X2 [Prosopis cineraria]
MVVVILNNVTYAWWSMKKGTKFVFCLAIMSSTWHALTSGLRRYMVYVPCVVEMSLKGSPSLLPQTHKRHLTDFVKSGSCGKFMAMLDWQRRYRHFFRFQSSLADQKHRHQPPRKFHGS